MGAGICAEEKSAAFLEGLESDSKKAAEQLCERAGLKSGQLVVVGCSSSEAVGHNVGSYSSPQTAQAIFNGIYSVLKARGIWLAAQCCEHLNRAIIIERAAVTTQELVNVVPQVKAGGSFATAAYAAFTDPVAVEEIKADAGLDIGGTLIGMHLKRVAVPIRLDVRQIGEAVLLAARTRPRFVGGERAVYDEKLL